MFIDRNSIVINGVNLGNYITQVTFGYNKLWADGGRTLSGSMTGTLVGIYPKLVIQFGKLTKSQLETIIPILDSPTQTTTYYDPYKRTNVTMQTYTGDYEIVNKRVIEAGAKNEGFSCSFIAKSKRV